MRTLFGIIVVAPLIASVALFVMPRSKPQGDPNDAFSRRSGRPLPQRRLYRANRLKEEERIRESIAERMRGMERGFQIAKTDQKTEVKYDMNTMMSRMKNMQPQADDSTPIDTSVNDDLPVAPTPTRTFNKRKEIQHRTACKAGETMITVDWVNGVREPSDELIAKVQKFLKGHGNPNAHKAVSVDGERVYLLEELFLSDMPRTGFWKVLRLDGPNKGKPCYRHFGQLKMVSRRAGDQEVIKGYDFQKRVREGDDS